MKKLILLIILLFAVMDAALMWLRVRGADMETTERAERNEKAIEFWKSHCVNGKCS